MLKLTEEVRLDRKPRMGLKRCRKLLRSAETEAAATSSEAESAMLSFSPSELGREDS